MSRWKHCDGPTCDKARDTRMADHYTLADLSWISAEQRDGGNPLDFCSPTCAAAYYAKQATR